MNGKAKCKILKEIRRQSAENNDIPYVVSECPYQGNCKGTCPQCEEEVRYLEREIQKRKNIGKAVAVGGIAASLLIGAVSCGSHVKEALEELLSTDQPDGAVSAVDIGE